MDKNTRTLTLALTLVAVMIGLSFAAVPLYDLFCRVTGLGGTTRVATGDIPDKPLAGRVIDVRFNADVNRDMPWDFKSDQRSVRVKLGEQKLISYRANNPTNAPVVGTAIYNVTPPKVGKYFHKIQCFCFQDQVLNPGQDIHMPVLFYVDPKLADDPEMADVSTITLSYTFFRSQSREYERALEAYTGTK
jgi:cytochrome c oxidase assembly protein subunit 11